MKKKGPKVIIESEQTFRTIFDNAPDGIVLADVETKKFFLANKVFCELLGYNSQEIKNLGIINIHPEEDLPYVLEQFEKQLKKEITLAKNIPVRRKNGSIFYADINSLPVNLAGETYMMGFFRDITERRCAEEKLDILAKFPSENPNPVIRISKDCTILYANDSSSPILETWGRTVGERLPNDCCNWVDEAFDSAGSSSFEFKCRNGRIFSMTLALIVDAGYANVYGLDITELKEAEEQVANTLARLEYVLATSPATIYTCKVGDNWAATFISENIRDQFAYDPSQFVEDSSFWIEHIHPDDRQRVIAGLSRLFEDDFNVHEYRFLHKDGIYRWVRDELRLIRDGQGRPLECIGYWMDITKRKKAEEALQESDERLRVALSAAQMGTWRWDPVTNQDTRDASLNLILGLEAVESTQPVEDFLHFVHPEDRDKTNEEIQRAIRERRTYLAEFRIIRPDGTVRWLRDQGKPLCDENDRVLCLTGAIIDITERKKAEEKLNIFREKMARAEQLISLGTLSATLAHEMAQPLTVIRLSIEDALARLEDSSSPDNITEKLKDSLNEVSNITSITKRFRNFAGMSSDKTLTEVDLMAIGERIVKLLNESARRASVALRLNFMDKLPPVYSSEKDIEQLFFALIDNAIKANVSKKNRQIIVSGTVKDEHIELQFSDNCGGIAQDNLNKIFEPFFTTRPLGEGTGLGLSIVQQIVTRAGGTIRVKSKFGSGSTFIVMLPINKITRSYSISNDK